jgi:hypothetical protein
MAKPGNKLNPAKLMKCLIDSIKLFGWFNFFWLKDEYGDLVQFIF